MTVEVGALLKRLVVEASGGSAAEDGIREDTPLFGAGVGLGSVEATLLMVKVEEAFDLYLEPADMAAAVETFGALLAMVRRKLAEPTP